MATFQSLLLELGFKSKLLTSHSEHGQYTYQHCQTCDSSLVGKHVKIRYRKPDKPHYYSPGEEINSDRPSQTLTRTSDLNLLPITERFCHYHAILVPEDTRM